MAKKEETPEPAEKPEGETPAEEEVSAEKPESETPAEGKVSAEQGVEAEEPETIQQETAREEISKDARMWAMFCHLAGLAWLIWWIVPLIGGVIGTLIVWQVKKDVHSFIDEHGKEACNFQISMLIYGIVAGLLCFACVGVVLLPAVVIFDFIFMLIAAVKANDGYHYRYPLSIRFIK